MWKHKTIHKNNVKSMKQSLFKKMYENTFKFTGIKQNKTKTITRENCSVSKIGNCNIISKYLMNLCYYFY